MRPTVLVTVIALAGAAAAQAQDADARLKPHAIGAETSRAMRVEAARAYQGRNQGSEQTERFSRKVRVGRDGRVRVENISGNIVITTGSGDEVSIEAVKRTRGSQNELANVQIIVDERPGRVEIRTEHERNFRDRGRSDHTSVDYTLTIPSGASIDAHSVSGSVKVTGARGAARAETVSGDVVVVDCPKLELAKSVSGNVTLSGVQTDGDLAAGSVSGDVIAKAVKVHGLDLNSVSGNLSVTDVTCDRLAAKSVSGNVEYAGGLARGGTYDINVHSGTIRLTLSNPPGFVFNANTFSGSIRSDFPMTIGGDADRTSRGDRRSFMGNRSMRATYGDGSATLTLRSFSGDIVLSKR